MVTEDMEALTEDMEVVGEMVGEDMEAFTEDSEAVTVNVVLH